MVDHQATRQLSTICAIDAVGFSRLMNENQETAVAIFQERRSAISETVAEFGGRVFGAAGDSMMAEFGSPVEALRASLETQARVEKLNASVAEQLRMPFRIGIATGVVIFDEGGIFGDCVNVSARLQEFSPRAVSPSPRRHSNTSMASFRRSSPISARCRSRTSPCRCAS